MANKTSMIETDIRQELSRTVSRGRKEILADVRACIVPATVGSFADLHDYTDANKYGGAFEDSAHDADDADFWNAVQDHLNKWIESGGLASAASAAR